MTLHRFLTSGSATAESEEESRRSSPLNHGEAQDEGLTEASNKQAEQQDDENMDKAPGNGKLPPKRSDLEVHLFIHFLNFNFG